MSPYDTCQHCGKDKPGNELLLDWDGDSPAWCGDCRDFYEDEARIVLRDYLTEVIERKKRKEKS